MFAVATTVSYGARYPDTVARVERVSPRSTGLYPVLDAGRQSLKALEYFGADWAVTVYEIISGYGQSTVYSGIGGGTRKVLTDLKVGRLQLSCPCLRRKNVDII